MTERNVGKSPIPDYTHPNFSGITALAEMDINLLQEYLIVLDSFIRMHQTEEFAPATLARRSGLSEETITLLAYFGSQVWGIHTPYKKFRQGLSGDHYYITYHNYSQYLTGLSNPNITSIFSPDIPPWQRRRRLTELFLDCHGKNKEYLLPSQKLPEERVGRPRGKVVDR